MAPILASFTGRNQFGGAGGSGMLTSGGTEYTNGEFTIKAFFYNSGSSENFTIDSAPPGSELEIVVIGGGGGGNGGYGSGGGGGGGCINYIPVMTAVSGHTHEILVGSGGPAGTGSADNTANDAATHGRRGANSTFTYAGSTTFTAGGGGGGNESFYYSSDFKDSDGNSGSGGGGGDWWPSQRGGGNATRAQAWSGGYRVGPLTAGGNGSMLYGFNGGSRDYEDGGHAQPHEGSGGGGAAGMPNTFGNTGSSASASSGGKGMYMPQYDFGSVGSPSGWFAGGGGGGHYYTGGGGGTRTNGTNVGGYFGGGGQGSHVSGGVSATGGVNNTGGGGGAGGYQSASANGNGPGGHGIVLVRYRTSGGKITKGEGDGSSSASPALSASHILAANPSASDGWYWIEAAGIVRQVWCDMSNGGWMAMSGCSTGETAHRHVADLVENAGYAPANISTTPAQTYNQGQQFINGLVRLGRQGGAALMNVNGNVRYFNITSSAEWAPLFTRRGTNWGSTDTQHTHPGNQWLKTAYTSWTNDSGNNGGGTFGGTTISWSGSSWGTFPYNMNSGDSLNFGYSIDPQYNTSYDHNGNAGTNWPGAHASGWSRAAAWWVRVSPNATA